MTDADRHKRMQALDKERGIVSARVRIPKRFLEDLRAFARDCRNRDTAEREVTHRTVTDV